MDSTSLTFHPYSYLTYPSSIFFGETVCRLLPVAPYKTLSFHPKCSSSRAYATNRQCSSSSRKSVVAFVARAVSDDNFSSNASSDKESSRGEELIALFKRIQTEISQEKSGSGKYIDTSQATIDDDSYVETSVLKLQQSNKGSEGESSISRRGEEPTRERTTKNEKSISISQSPSTNKHTRPRSNFVKISPIPSLNPLQSSDIEVNNGELSSSEADKGSSKIEGLKLSDLKKLAKERGIRGYSKLKKSELVQLLNS